MSQPTAASSVTLSQAFLEWAGRDPDDVVVTFERRRTAPVVQRRRDVVGMVWREAAGLRAANVGRGDRVVIALPTSPEYFAMFWACQVAGAIAVPAHPPALSGGGVERLDTMIRVAEPRAIRTTAEAAAEVAGRYDVAIAEPIDSADRTLASGVDSHDCALLQFTSGSTSSPRGCAIDHAAVLANLDALTVATRFRPGDVGVSWCPLYHDMGLIASVVWPIVTDLRGAILDPAQFLMNPLSWLRSMSEHRAAVSMAPNFAFELVVKKLRGRPPELDLSSVRTIINGGEPIDADTLEAFVSVLAPSGLDAAAVTPAWGMAETTLVATASVDGPRTDTVRRDELSRGRAVPAAPGGGVPVVSVGRPVGGARVRVVDRHGSWLPERSIGAVELQSGSLMSHYVTGDERADDPFRDGWLVTGDVGYVADGDLYLVGRSKELIIIGGRNISPIDVERLAGGTSGVRAGAVVAFGVRRAGTEQLVVVAETRMGSPPSGASVRERCRHALGIVPRDVVFVRPRTLPKTSSGKLRRVETRRRYLAGELDAVDTKVTDAS